MYRPLFVAAAAAGLLLAAGTAAQAATPAPGLSAAQTVSPQIGRLGCEDLLYSCENDEGTAVSGPSSTAWCPSSTTGAEACFDPDGDVWYVKDTKSDGYSAVASWGESYSDGTERGGLCINSLGAGTWAKCNKDYHEGALLDFDAAQWNAPTETFGAIDDSDWEIYANGNMP